MTRRDQLLLGVLVVRSSSPLLGGVASPCRVVARLVLGERLGQRVVLAGLQVLGQLVVGDRARGDVVAGAVVRGVTVTAGLPSLGWAVSSMSAGGFCSPPCSPLVLSESLMPSPYPTLTSPCRPDGEGLR